MGGHDRDAGGDPELLERKAELRDRLWSRLEESGDSRFPGVRGRIPNFTGAEKAADRLRSTEEWKRARAVKANPDSPQWPVRTKALEDGKLVYMAVPRLAGEDPFFLLDPNRIRASPRDASSIRGASKHATTVGVDEMEPVDLVVTGCVGASTDGARLGKGGGFSDLEYAVALDAGVLSSDTPVATTVHELQVVPGDEIPLTAHDLLLDLVATPDRVLRPERGGRNQPTGVLWDELTEEKIEAIPLLQRLRPNG